MDRNPTVSTMSIMPSPLPSPDCSMHEKSNELPTGSTPEKDTYWIEATMSTMLNREFESASPATHLHIEREREREKLLWLTAEMEKVGEPTKDNIRQEVQTSRMLLFIGRVSHSYLNQASMGPIK